MPFYDYRCTRCGEFEVCRNMKDTGLRPCPMCGCPSQQVITAPLFSEDRTRFRDYRKALGTSGPSPSSRSELRAIEKTKGIYFTNELTAKEKRLKEYAQHVKSGGDRLDPAVVNPEKVESKTLREAMREKGVRLG